MACLLVGVDEDLVPMLLLLDGLVKKRPDAALRGGPHVLAPIPGDLPALAQDLSPLRDRVHLQLIAKFPHVALLRGRRRDHRRKIVDHRDLDCAVLGGESAPGGTGIIGQAHSLACKARDIVHGQVHTFLQAVHEQGTVGAVALFYCLVGAVVAEGELLPLSHTAL